MTGPNVGEFSYIPGEGAASGAVVALDEVGGPSASQVVTELKPFPDAVIELSEAQRDALKIWVGDRLRQLILGQQRNQDNWAEYEKAYRAYPEPFKFEPFEGASNLVVPVIGMAVDPIHARLDTGIFKQDPVITLKALRKDVEEYMPSVQKFLNYWIKHVAKLRQIASPRILECTKLGTMVFKTVYDREVYNIKTYDPKDNYKVVTRKEVRYAGPRVFGISIGDFLFDDGYQFVQQCPIVAERMRTTYWQLKVAEASGKLKDVDSIKDTGKTQQRTALEDVRQEMSQKNTTQENFNEDIVIYEIHCDYDIDGDNIPEHLIVTFEPDTQWLGQVRYNWYFNQKKPYVVIPYTVTNESLLGIGLCEMVLPFQRAITKWEQMAEDNAYIANIRMFISKINSGIEDVPRLYTGRVFFVDDPRSDFIPFAVGDIYPSTISERQNLFGLVEKRTGVSDYLTGRESPIIGTRATATSTLALIQEGTKRVEQVLENFREGFSEIVMNCMSIWMQYGLEGLDDMVLGDDKVAQDVKAFFSTINQANVGSTIGIDLTATDASGNRSALQSMQLQLIQIMMGYYEKILEAMSIALQMQASGQPEAALVIKDTMIAARKLFTDLLHDYNIRNPEDYLPDLEKYLAPPNGGQSTGGVVSGPLAGAAGQPSVPASLPTNGRAGVPRPAIPGEGAGPGQSLSAPGLPQIP